MAEHGQADTIETRAGDEGTSARRLAGIYAEALLDAADKRGSIDAVGEELHGIVVDIFQADQNVEQMFGSPAIKRSQKGPLLVRAFQGKISDLLLDFLQVLNKNDRLTLIRHIAVAYQALCDRRSKKVRVQVLSAAALDDNQKQALRDTLQAALHKDPILDLKIDPELLGGMVVQIGDDVFDASVRTRIETLRKQLQASSSHEIQVGRDRFSSAV